MEDLRTFRGSPKIRWTKECSGDKVQVRSQIVANILFIEVRKRISRHVFRELYYLPLRNNLWSYTEYVVMQSVYDLGNNILESIRRAYAEYEDTLVKKRETF